MLKLGSSKMFIKQKMTQRGKGSKKPHCKPKPCKAYRELPVSQFSQGKTCFHYRVPLFSLQGPCFHYTDFPVNPCTTLLGIAVYCTTYKVIAVKELYPNSFRISSVTGKISNYIYISHHFPPRFKTNMLIQHLFPGKTVPQVIYNSI